MLIIMCFLFFFYKYRSDHSRSFKSSPLAFILSDKTATFLYWVGRKRCGGGVLALLWGLVNVSAVQSSRNDNRFSRDWSFCDFGCEYQNSQQRPIIAGCFPRGCVASCWAYSSPGAPALLELCNRNNARHWGGGRDNFTGKMANW